MYCSKGISKNISKAWCDALLPSLYQCMSYIYLQPGRWKALGCLHRPPLWPIRVRDKRGDASASMVDARRFVTVRVAAWCAFTNILLDSCVHETGAIADLVVYWCAVWHRLRQHYLIANRSTPSMLCPCRDTLLDVSARYLWVQCISGSMVWGFRRGLHDQVETEDERNPVDCKIKTKTKLRSTTDAEAILIIESPQLIVNKCTQMRRYESYGRNWKVREQWRSAATTITMSHGPGPVGEAVVKVQGERQKENKAR